MNWRLFALHTLSRCSVIRFWDHDLLTDTPVVAEEIFRILEEEGPSPRPSPGVPGEGE